MGLTAAEYRDARIKEFAAQRRESTLNDARAQFAENPHITHDLDIFRQTETTKPSKARVRCKRCDVDFGSLETVLKADFERLQSYCIEIPGVIGTALKNASTPHQIFKKTIGRRARAVCSCCAQHGGLLERALRTAPC